MNSFSMQRAASTQPRMSDVDAGEQYVMRVRGVKAGAVGGGCCAEGEKEPAVASASGGFVCVATASVHRDSLVTKLTDVMSELNWWVNT